VVAQYKRKRLIEEDSIDKPAKYVSEGSQRQHGKREAQQGLKDNLDYNDVQIRAEIQWEEEMRRASECWEREKLDPENYRCTCRFVEDEE
jgi:hypothetical protein